MVFEVPASKASIKQNRFEFKIGGKKFNVPKLQYLSGEVVEMLAGAEQRGGVHESAAKYAIFGPTGTPVGDAVRTLDAEQLDALIEAYYEASMVTTGESSASTDS